MLTRSHAATAVLALLIAGLAGFALSGLNTRAEANATEPQVIKTAYVDFLSVFKKEGKLQSDQRRLFAEADVELQQLETDMAPSVEALEAERKRWEPHDSRHYAAMRSLLDLQRKYNTERLDIESRAQRDLRSAAIESFVRLRNLATDIAKNKGYNQILNIVREPEKIAETQEDFRVLQQQLLLSPVLYFEPEHDITDLLAAEAKAKWGIEIKVELEGAVAVGADGKDGAALTKVPEGETNKARIDYKVRLGETVRFKTKVTNNGQPAAGKQAETAWTRTGLKSGEINDTGLYTAPKECPLASDIITIRVRSLVDSTTLDIRIQLVDKEGNPIDLVKLNQEKNAGEKKPE